MFFILLTRRINNKLKGSFLIGWVILLIASTCQAQSNLSLCNYLQNSSKVFIGTFQRQVGKKNSQGNEILMAEFSIKETLKGLNQNEEKISAISDIFAKHLQTGEFYLVFLRYDENLKEYVINAPFEVVFLDEEPKADKNERNNKLSGKFQIAFGDLGTDRENLKGFKVAVNANGKTYYPKFSSESYFTIVYSQNVKPTVSIEVPLETDVLITGNSIADIINEPGRTIIKYSLKELNCSCEYRQFQFTERKNK